MKFVLLQAEHKIFQGFAGVNSDWHRGANYTLAFNDESPDSGVAEGPLRVLPW
jgi:hypothetical protein